VRRRIPLLAAAFLACAAAERPPQPPPGEEDPGARNDFERDRERCWLQTTRSLRFRCRPGEICSVPIPDTFEFQSCMRRRGWAVEPDDTGRP
jgi:hypothetical protein